MVSFKTTKVAGSVSKVTTGRSSFSAKQPAGDPGWSKTYTKESPTNSITIKPVTLKVSSKFSNPISSETIKSRVQSFSMTLANKPSAPKKQLTSNVKTPTMSLNRNYRDIAKTTIIPQGSLKVLTARTSSFKAAKKS